MKNLTILKTIPVLALISGFSLSSALAEHRDGIGYAIAEVEHATDTLLLDYKRELVDRGLWKPRGNYDRLWKAIHRMEELGDSLKKHHGRTTSRTSLARVTAMIDHQLHFAEDVARNSRVSRRIHAGLKNVSVSTHRLTGYCGGRGDAYDDNRGRRYDRGRGYRDDREAYRPRPRTRSEYPGRRTFNF